MDKICCIDGCKEEGVYSYHAHFIYCKIHHNKYIRKCF